MNEVLTKLQELGILVLLYAASLVCRHHPVQSLRNLVLYLQWEVLLHEILDPQEFIRVVVHHLMYLEHLVFQVLLLLLVCFSRHGLLLEQVCLELHLIDPFDATFQLLIEGLQVRLHL